MDQVPYTLLLFFTIILGLCTWVLSWTIKRLRKTQRILKASIKRLDRHIKREENLSIKLRKTLQKHDIKFEEVDAILVEMSVPHNSS